MSTSNRICEGRFGTKEEMVYLANVKTERVSALTGRLTKIRELGIVYPGTQEPEHHLTSDDMSIFPGPKTGTPRLSKGLT